MAVRYDRYMLYNAMCSQSRTLYRVNHSQNPTGTVFVMTTK